ncbi:response regulator [Mucilaginibacter sp. UR6-1]|uniref:hybrid sensor histidine kinase/response regulator transcription factor n=1 Tax=Mucilaginibacter sp. UR6-1 TaxID=1435643 RepID=UPI001E328156|nr:hybrid sensor histidine kinase/response regulator transcription factor [Mucilaginibacter sp. UR6-1]MCC8411270.1 response regulator [Mucilaginibacter sp. UR6-1]
MTKPLFMRYVFALLLFWQNAFGQNDKYAFSHINVNTGLSHNNVTAFIKDSRGFLWIGTQNGLNRYDGNTFKLYQHDAANPKSLSDNFIISIFDAPGDKFWIKTQSGYSIYDQSTESFSEDVGAYLNPYGVPDYRVMKILKGKNGNYYFLHAVEGLFIYNPVTRKTRSYPNVKGKSGSLYSINVADMHLDSKGNVWIVYKDGVIDKFDTRVNKVTYRSTAIANSLERKSYQLYRIFVDAQDDIWLYSGPIGAFYLNPANGTIKHFYRDAPGQSLNANLVNSIIQDNNGKIWLSTDPGGVNLIDKNGFTISYLVKKENDSKSLSQNSLTELYKDDLGTIWVGTYKKGFNYYNQNVIKFPLYRHNPLQPNTIGYDDVNAFAEDAKGNLWIGTNGGGLIYYDRKAEKFTRYINSKTNSNSLSNNVIVSLAVDHEQKLWIGTYFGGLDCFDGKTFTHYRHNETDPYSLSDDRVYEIKEDHLHRLWIGTLSGGLNVLGPDRKKFTFYRAFKPNSIHSDYIFSIIEDSKNNIWVGTSDGIDVIAPNGKIAHYKHINGDPNSLVYNNVYSLLESRNGNICIGTREGLNILNPKTKQLKLYSKQDGLPDNNIVSLEEDAEGNLWMGTANGLSQAKPIAVNGEQRLKFINFNERDGLQGRQFNDDASLITRKGELLFGGGNGFNLFNPSSIKLDKTTPRFVFTDFQLFNTSIKPGEKVNGDVILSKLIADTKTLTLDYDADFFSVDFAALNFLNPENVRYSYKMQGFDDDWILADNKVRKATYTNLSPGDYTFIARAEAIDNSWKAQTISLKITILPPFWRSTAAYICYLILALAILFYIRYRGIKKLKAQFALEQERKEVARQRELDSMKIKFLTNVSHEFKTPISLIMAPVDKLLKDPALSEQGKDLGIIKKNAYRLLNLVNQLLDLRKLETRELKLNLKEGNIIAFIKGISYSFTDIAEQSNIQFAFDTDTVKLDTIFDHDKVERVLLNLLSNAFKFTPAGGNVSVFISSKMHAENTGYCTLKISVIDTGIGIPADKVDKIFERFFQNDAPASMINQGNGIGLSIAKEFVKMHNGVINVEHVANGGSCFTVELPLPVKEAQVAGNARAENKAKATAQDLNKKAKVLLVEDNDDFRFYLKDNLAEHYTILEAVNGKEGWQKALAFHPDLIVSDISMAEMDGLQLSSKIKADSRTSHIPVILLTAMPNEETLLQGLNTGANDYLVKPLNFDVLQSKIKNLLALQMVIKNSQSKKVDVQLHETAIPSADQKFMDTALQYIETNLQNANLSVEELSRHMCMSRVSLYKKMLLLTGKTPVDFIRSIRLRKAAGMLAKSQLTVSEISYQVGFNTPHYFAKTFKAEYDMLPSDYIHQHRKETQHREV